jgi:hypothetical protein
MYIQSKDLNPMYNFKINVNSNCKTLKNTFIENKMFRYPF